MKNYFTQWKKGWSCYADLFLFMLCLNIYCLPLLALYWLLEHFSSAHETNKVIVFVAGVFYFPFALYKVCADTGDFMSRLKKENERL